MTSDDYDDILADAPSRSRPDRVLRTHTSDVRRSHSIASTASRTWEPASERRPLPADLHVGLDRLPEGGALHAGPVRARRGCTSPASPSSAPDRPCTRRCRSSTAARCSPGSPARSMRRCRSGAGRGSRRRGRMPDIRRMGATMLTYTGKVLNYILAVPPSPDDATSPLQLAIGNEASESDIREFAARFHCQVRDSYGSTEGMIIIRRDASMPRGVARPRRRHHRGLRPRDRARVPARGVRRRRPPAERRSRGRRDRQHGAAATASRATTATRKRTRRRSATASTGPATSRTATHDGWFFFAGRSNEWLRVDGENFAAGTVEAIIMRIPGRAIRGRLRRPRRSGRRPGDGRDRGRRRRRVRRRRVRRVPRASSPTSARSGCRASCVPDGRAAEAREHEDRQDAVAERRLDRTGDLLAPRADETLRPMTPSDVERLAHLRR